MVGSGLGDGDGGAVGCEGGSGAGAGGIDVGGSGVEPLLEGGVQSFDLRCRGSAMLDHSNEVHYYFVVIVSFADRETERLASGERVRRFVAIEAVARRKLRQLEIAGRLDDLRVPPGNRLEVLKGDRKGRMSVRINDQWRVCFRWTQAGPANVEIVDYH